MKRKVCWTKTVGLGGPSVLYGWAMYYGTLIDPSAQPHDRERWYNRLLASSRSLSAIGRRISSGTVVELAHWNTWSCRSSTGHHRQIPTRLARDVLAMSVGRDHWLSALLESSNTITKVPSSDHGCSILFYQSIQASKTKSFSKLLFNIYNIIPLYY